MLSRSIALPTDRRLFSAYAQLEDLLLPPIGPRQGKGTGTVEVCQQATANVISTVYNSLHCRSHSARE